MENNNSFKMPYFYLRQLAKAFKNSYLQNTNTFPNYISAETERLPASNAMRGFADENAESRQSGIASYKAGNQKIQQTISKKASSKTLAKEISMLKEEIEELKSDYGEIRQAQKSFIKKVDDLSQNQENNKNLIFVNREMINELKSELEEIRRLFLSIKNNLDQEQIDAIGKRIDNITKDISSLEDNKSDNDFISDDFLDDIDISAE